MAEGVGQPLPMTISPSYIHSFLPVCGKIEAYISAASLRSLAIPALLAAIRSYIVIGCDLPSVLGCFCSSCSTYAGGLCYCCGGIRPLSMALASRFLICSCPSLSSPVAAPPALILMRLPSLLIVDAGSSFDFFFGGAFCLGFFESMIC